jgi:hypothetical protein
MTTLKTRLRPYEIVLGLAMASLIIIPMAGYALGPLPLIHLLSVVTMPMACLMGGITLFWRQEDALLHRFNGLLMAGAAWGLASTLMYDVYRPLVKIIFGYAFDPYRVMPIFGHILTGLPTNHYLALITGWAYHLWIGILMGMIFGLVRPKGGALAGLIFVLIVQTIRLAAYPSILQASLEDPEFLANGVFGFGLWGVVLGIGLKKGGWRDA